MKVDLYISEVDGHYMGETLSICINTNIEELKNTPVEFWGDSKQCVIDQVIAVLRSKGLSGRLHVI